jgi:hypothetical protein
VHISERTLPPQAGTERETLNAFLQSQRDTLEWKCGGLSRSQLIQAAIAPSPMTLLGLLRHMTVVEYHWFEFVLTNSRDHQSIYRSQASPDGDWTDLSSHSPEDVLLGWRGACKVSTRNASALQSLDSTAALTWDDEPVSLRWITCHMTREYARHVGHADLLRERIDGQTGE